MDEHLAIVDEEYIVGMNEEMNDRDLDVQSHSQTDACFLGAPCFHSHYWTLCRSLFPP